MYLLGIDIETTGLDPERDSIIELGMSIYNTETKCVVKSLSLLVNDMSDPTMIPKSIQELTGIRPMDVVNFGVTLQQATATLNKFAGFCDGWVAHNAEFEEAFLRFHNPQGCVLQLPCLDTMNDIPYPHHIKDRALEKLGLIHRYPNFNAHRALPDVLAMFDILKCYEWKEVESYWLSPSHLYQAQCTIQNKDDAKALGFKWNPNGWNQAEGKNGLWECALRQAELENVMQRVKDEKLKVNIIIID